VVSRSHHQVETAIPFPTDLLPDEQWAAACVRLQALLHGDTSVLRSPLTGLTMLAPLLSALTAPHVPVAKS